MTRYQIKICKIIQKKRTLPAILSAGKIADYNNLQNLFTPGSLSFSDCNMDDNTVVSLTNPLIEELENYRLRMTEIWFTRTLAIIAIVISLIALLSELGILGLPQYSQPC